MIPGLPHHVTRRGNNRQDVFFVEDDCGAHLGPLKKQAQRFGLAVHDAAGRLRLSTSRGRPLATDSFLSKLERLLGRRLRPLPVGRPKKNRSKAGEPSKQ